MSFAFDNVVGGIDDSDAKRDMGSSFASDLDTNEGYPVDNILPGFHNERVVLDFIAPSGFQVHADLILEIDNGCQVSGFAIGG